jgi:phosphate-selective porin OprO/OprP
MRRRFVVRLLLVAGAIVCGGSRAAADSTETDTRGVEPRPRQIRWYVDHGLNMELRRFGLLEEIAGPASELLVHVQTGFRLSLDGAEFSGDDQGAESGGLRRAYIRVRGEFWPWRRPITFYLEIGVINGAFSLDQSYLTVPTLPYAGDLQVGQLDPPMSMDALASSFARPFMEKSLAIDALVPSPKAGVLVANRNAAQDVTWALGWFADGTNTEDGENNNSPTRFTGRLTWLAFPGGEDAVPLLHFGASASYMYSANRQIRYDTRAESNWAPKLFDTNGIDGRESIVLGNELAAAHGPWSLQGELVAARVQGERSGDSNFGGGYVLGTWCLTGEPRPYNRRSGHFTAVTPQRPVALGARNAGAWEVALRLSYLDLVDGLVRGGRGIELMPGLNWYLTPYFRLQLNYGYTHVEDGPQNGNLHLVQGRVDVSL